MTTRDPSLRHRLHALCPYFAMFPQEFVAKHVESYTLPGERVYDPFCGRGTAVLQPLLMGRISAGSDINPVAYCVSKAKARPPQHSAVLARLNELKLGFRRATPARYEHSALPKFFSYAFRRDTLNSLLFLRRVLDWQNDDTDRFIAALALGSLHGEMDRSSAYFSNQMPRTISTKPEYSIKYWRRHSLVAPKRDVFEILRKKAEYRLSDGLPRQGGDVALCDVREASEVFRDLEGKVRLIITSPPYLNVTRFEEDQWLRLWFLGADPKPTYGRVSRDDRYCSEENYWDFLAEAWEGVAPLVTRGAVLVCRLAGKGMQAQELSENLYDSVLSVFPRAYMIGRPKQSKIRNRQTGRFQPNSKGCLFELDHAFCLN